MTKKSIRIMTVLLLLALLCAAVACKPSGTETETNTDKNETESNMNNQITSSTDEQTNPNQPGEPSYVSLDGKKIIFIGNSFIYYGQTVLVKSQSVLQQSQRINDKGYFYQICKSNGENVSVTNWTFGGHSLTHLFGGNCAANRGCDGVDHLSYLTDRNYDYVVISAGSGTSGNDLFVENMDQIMSIFRDANPDVKFVYLCNAAPYGFSSVEDKSYRQTNILNHLKVLEEQGVTVVDWGKLVTDLIYGNTTVPNAKQSYDQNSFIVQQSAKDGYHPNLLTGYITTLMTYCAVTGRTATDQSYSFCATTGTSFSAFKSKYYSYNGATSNFIDIFHSSEDMRGLQQLVDQYLAEKPYLQYDYQ